MRSIFTALSLVVTTLGIVGIGLAQQPSDEEWKDLFRQKKPEEARRLCTSWLASNEILRRAEAHKCLANVALLGEEVMWLQGNDAGGGTVSFVPKPEAVDQALAHLEEALKLVPQDLSVHQGRLHLLEISARYPEMTQALEESCTIYKGANGLDAWLAYTSELFDAKQFRASLALSQVLERHFPDSHDVVGNIGAALAMLKEDEQAAVYLRRAVELAPTDPVDTWNLARLYDFTDKLELAETWYQKALSLESDLSKRRQQSCTYSSFVEHKLHDAKRACEIQKENCSPKEQSACASPK